MAKKDDTISGTYMGPVERVVNGGHLNEDGTISILVFFGGQGYDMQFSTEQAEFIRQGLADALRQAKSSA